MGLLKTSMKTKIKFIFLFISEYNHTLLDHNTLFGKLTNAAFGSVTPRTAGFNVVDYSSMTVPSLLAVIKS